MSKWIGINKKADFNQIAEQYHIDPVIARIMRNRELITEEDMQNYLYGTSEAFHSYTLLKDMKKAVAILAQKIKDKKKLRIVGDYDVDGVCATYILWKGLSRCGAVIDCVIPERMKDGYGISNQLIEDAVIQEIDTIITCDNGIAALKAISFAKKEGLTCIITDHHEVPYEECEGKKIYTLPQADAIIDPKQEDCSYPYKGICGAYVAYKLIEGIFEQFHIADTEKQELMEMAGIATVCDVMDLTDENRVLVKQTLLGLQNAKNPGMKALIQVNKLDVKTLTAYHIGFIIGPCINATGRMDTAQIALELLQSQTFEDAIVSATKLKQLNESRKELTEKGIEDAKNIIEEKKWMQDKVMVVYLPNLHESLAGIIAGRIREQYIKPVFVLTKSEDIVKGSARSIEAYSLYEEMTKCKEFFTQYGGHRMAAGFSMKEENIDAFRTKINEICTLTPEDYEETIRIDVPMPFSYVKKELIEQFSLLEPFGPGNTKPVFAQKNLEFLNAKKMGNGNMAKFTVSDMEHNRYEVVLFRNLEQFISYVKDKYGAEAVTKLFTEENKSGKQTIMLDVIYYPSLNEYRGRSSIQFIMQDYR